ncbi:hypothetical protein Dda_2596 [Drechslerella dactyloides]|uniref:Leucine carboxyl methyltransferase 1 n=1 Tax=Drechslerella dactyloides TaxID=74499 RepID=A0AAD6J0Q6_DREDA|nr:hypothetical protein Dda_2596 [Drechslerella dactyloides]
MSMTVPTRFLIGPVPTGADKDRVVQQTDNDALLARWSAINSGYLEDTFTEQLMDPLLKKERRYPLINRGTYVRTSTIDRLVADFLSKPTKSMKQIISLGAGSDTRFFRFIPGQSRPFLYHELDFPVVTTRKIKSIQQGQDFILGMSCFGEPNIKVDLEAGSLQSQYYYIHPIDLRTVKPGSPIPEHIDPTLPTLFISECCLIYLSPNEADDIFRWIVQSFGQASETKSNSVGIILYEPIKGGDGFGLTMIENLAVRGIVLKTLHKYSSLERQIARMQALGFTSGNGACDINYIHNKWIEAREMERIDKLELLDEREEWTMLAQHYCVAWGWVERGQQFEDTDHTPFRKWSELLQQEDIGPVQD